jgi:transcriptional repressor NrdR
MEKLTEIVGKVENKVRGLGENEVSSQVIGEFVMNELKDLDEIAYIRFASVYRQFKDVSAFMDELQGIIGQHHDK